MDFGTVAPGEPEAVVLTQRADLAMLLDTYAEACGAGVVVAVGPIDVPDAELELWRQVVHSVFVPIVERDLPFETAAVRAGSGPAGSRFQVEVELRSSLVVPLFDIDRVRLWSLSSAAADLAIAFDATIIDDVLLITLTSGPGARTIDLVNIEDDRPRGTREQA